MSNQEFNIATMVNYILLLTQQPNAKENISLLLESLFEFSRKEKAEEARIEKAASSIVIFTNKELSKMPQQFRKLFKIGKVRAHVKRRTDGVYEIRCQLNKVLYLATSKQLEECKEKFIQKLKLHTTVQANDVTKPTNVSEPLFIDYMFNWLETAKKPFIKEITYNDYVNAVKVYILPKFENRTLSTIKYNELQTLITELSESGRNRTAKKIFQLLSPFFAHAMADGAITLNPMAKVKLPRYETNHGVALTINEEYEFLQEIKRNPTPVNQAYAFILYTGLRRCELSSIVIDGEWIKIITAKQRKGMKEKSRSIPISPMLKKVLPFINIEEIKSLSLNILTKSFKDVCPKHHLHDLRHTFITRAQECGIRREIVSLWAGHQADSSITTAVYTHFQERSELQISEMQKYNYKYN